MPYINIKLAGVRLSQQQRERLFSQLTLNSSVSPFQKPNKAETSHEQAAFRNVRLALPRTPG